MRKRVSMKIKKEDLRIIDDHVHRLKKKGTTNRTEFMVQSALFKIEFDKRKKKPEVKG